MKKIKLSSSEIHDLIARYRSELKKLDYQVSELSSTITQLEKTLKTIKISEKAAKSKAGKKKLKTTSPAKSKTKIKKKRGRPAKKAASAKKPAIKTKTIKAKKPGRPKKVIRTIKKSKKPVEKKGYKLSPWDSLVMNSIKDAGKARISQEILDYVSIKMKESGKSVTDAEVKNKVIRSLQKLANRRKELKKVPYAGKGFAYALPEWFDEKGKLNKDNNR
jgi:hypothetical protein